MSWIPIPFPWGKTKESVQESVNVEEYVEKLESPDGMIEEEGVIYVKSVDLSSEDAVDDTLKEFKNGNIVILDLSRIISDAEGMYRKINAIKKFCTSNGGDICRVSAVKVMVLPEGIEVVYPSNQEQVMEE